MYSAGQAPGSGCWGRGSARGVNALGVQVLENLPDDRRGGDEGEDAHLGSAGTQQRVDFVDASEQLCPTTPLRGAVPPPEALAFGARRPVVVCARVRVGCRDLTPVVPYQRAPRNPMPENESDGRQLPKTANGPAFVPLPKPPPRMRAPGVRAPGKLLSAPQMPWKSPP